MIETMQDRAAAHGMDVKSYLRWRQALRQDYHDTFHPPPYRPASALPYGWMVTVLELGPPPKQGQATVVGIEGGVTIDETMEPRTFVRNA